MPSALVASLLSALAAGSGLPALDGIRILPPPPGRASPLAMADRAIFTATRTLRGSARWELARQDVTNAPLRRYACALGISVSPQQAPHLAALLDGLSTANAVDPVKQLYGRPRPYLHLREPICQTRTSALARNGDYPSGHAANGWLEALVLAQIAPRRASQILERGRQYGESRAICGAHSYSAVQAGWLLGSATFAILQASPTFQASVVNARAEYSHVRASGARPDVRRCRRDAQVLATFALGNVPRNSDAVLGR